MVSYWLTSCTRDMLTKMWATKHGLSELIAGINIIGWICVFIPFSLIYGSTIHYIYSIVLSLWTSSIMFDLSTRSSTETIRQPCLHHVMSFPRKTMDKTRANLLWNYPGPAEESCCSSSTSGKESGWPLPIMVLGIIFIIIPWTSLIYQL